MPKSIEEHRKYHREHQRIYRESHKDKIMLINLRNANKRHEQLKVLSRKRKESFLNMYGNRCSCCGETHYEFLTIEHKNGKKDKNETGQRAYKKALENYRPDLYEILCWNCNCSKGRYGYCPHQMP